MGDAPHQLALTGGRAEGHILLLGRAALRGAGPREGAGVSGGAARRRRAAGRLHWGRASLPAAHAADAPAAWLALQRAAAWHDRRSQGLPPRLRTLGAIVKDVGRQGQRSCGQEGGGAGSGGGSRPWQARTPSQRNWQPLAASGQGAQARQRAPSTGRRAGLACASFRRMACKGESAERPGQAMAGQFVPAASAWAAMQRQDCYGAAKQR